MILTSSFSSYNGDDTSNGENVSFDWDAFVCGEEGSDDDNDDDDNDDDDEERKSCGGAKSGETDIEWDDNELVDCADDTLTDMSIDAMSPNACSS
mmetsp:Transcript_53753/g.64846  ORF Transcript_53753/g.64846 Transcript_53753/m.64846 type:complete len:95 (-) Transcript_53753:1911-2195(-)